MELKTLKILGLGMLLLITACGKSSSETSETSSSSMTDSTSETTSYFSYDSNISYQEYTVTFVTNAATSLDPVVTSLIEVMPTLENGELTLEGWYFDAAFTQYVNFPLFVDHDMTLYARWIEASDGFIYTPTLDGLGYIVESYIGNATIIALPSTYNGKPVLELGEYLFYNNGSLISIALPSQLRTIGMAAFKNATQLGSISLPNMVTHINTDAFSGASALSQITFSSSLQFIGNNAFDFCTSLTSIDLPASLQTISARSFASITALTSVTIRALTPPLRFDTSFEGASSTLKFYVPASAVSTYKTNEYWVAYADQIFSI